MSAAPLTFTNMIDDAAILSFEHQLYLGDILGENFSFEVDLGTPRIEFTGDHPVVCSSEVPFLALRGAPTQPHEVVALMIDAAKVFSGRWFAYNGDAGGGTRVAFLIQHQDFVLPPPEAARVLRVIQQSIAELTLYDHRRALHNYALRRPLAATFSSDHSQLVPTGARMRISIDFDHLGRATTIDGALG